MNLELEELNLTDRLWYRPRNASGYVYPAFGFVGFACDPCDVKWSYPRPSVFVDGVLEYSKCFNCNTLTEEW